MKKAFLRRGISLLLCLVFVVALTPAVGAYYNPSHEVISDPADSRIQEIDSLVARQSYGSVHARAYVQSMVGYLLTGSKYAAVGGECFPYLNANGYANTVDDGIYQINVYASGCYAYSKYASAICYAAFGQPLYPRASYGNAISSIWALDSAALESFIRSECQAGEHIRLISGVHSVTFLAADEEGFYYSDYSGDSRAAIRLCYISFENFHSALRNAGTGIYVYNANTCKNVDSVEIKLTIGQPNMLVNGVSQPIDGHGTVPAIVGDRTMLPIRSIIEAMGGSVAWDAATRTVTLTVEGLPLCLRIDSTTVWDNAGAFELVAAPIIMNDRTMVPVRVLEYFQAQVLWNAAERSVTITYSGIN